jgi:hypothetical protein
MWREDVVAWARAIAASASDAGDPPAAPAIAALGARLALAADLVPALVLAYGLHLGGELGAAPVALARVLGHRWDEALGTGELARRGIVEHVAARIRLARPILHVLDELPPIGAMLGSPGEVALRGPCVVIATDARLADVAARYVARVGAIVIGEGAAAREVLVEGRARGAVPLVRVEDVVRIPDEPAIIVVPDEAAAARLDLPRL